MAHTWILVHSWGPEQWFDTDLLNQRFSFFWDVGWSACFLNIFISLYYSFNTNMGTIQLVKLQGVFAGTKLLQEHVSLHQIVIPVFIVFHVLWEMKQQHPCNIFLCNWTLEVPLWPINSVYCTWLCHSDFLMWPFESKYLNKTTGLILSKVTAPTSPFQRGLHKNVSEIIV